MERPGDHDPATAAPEVGLADAGIAAQIATAAARGREADRTPTLEQLLAAFGEREPTPAARRRVAAALRVAGMGVRPDLLEAEPGQRLLLLPPDAPAPTRRRAVAGVIGLAAVLVVAAGAAALMGQGGESASDSLPPTVTTELSVQTTPDAIATDTTTDGAAATTAADPATEPATDATGTTIGDTTTTTTTTSTTADQAAAARERRRKARERRHKAAAAQRRHTVTVVVDASSAPTFLCADDGAGHQLYGGTLSGRQTFRGAHVRLNVGLASTVVTVDGNRIPLPGSPAGLDISRHGGVQPLPVGQRPCA